MTNTNAKSEKAFIRQVLLFSLVLLLVFSALGFIIYKNLSSVKQLSIKALSALGSYDAAIELSMSMEEEEPRLQSSYYIAEKMLGQRDFSDAAELFKVLGDYEDSEEKYIEACYLHADALYAEGEYELAMDAFAAVSGYSDSAERQKACVYAMANEAFERDDYLKASSLFAGLGSYSDAQQRAFDSAFALTGDEASASIIVSSGGLSAEAVEKAAMMSSLRSSLPLGRLALGSYHTVFLRTDGTVAAVGDNSHGQCDVSGWKNITQVCAGAKHSVALRADGSVAAAGDNSYGQCDVSGWKNVVKIAAGDYDTVALLKDGSFVSCGYHDYGKLENAGKLKSIFAGSYGVAGVNELGYLVSSHKSIAAENPQLIMDMALGTGCNAALYADGRLISALLGDEIWEDIVQVDLSPRALLAIDKDGQIHSRFFRAGDAVEFSISGKVLLCGAGAEHYVFMLEDGSLAAFGDSSFGQCNIQNLY